jgi:hypothetical protein
MPVERPRHSLPGLAGVAETAAGIVEYFPDQPIVGDSIAWYGEYLQSQVSLLVGLLKPDAIMLEVNAGVGMHALSLAPALGRGGHMFLYEPRPVFQQVLRQNLAANRVANVTVIKRNLTGANGPAVPADGNDSRTDVARASTMDTIDDLRLERLHWLKIAEASDPIQVLRSAAESLWRLRPNLFVAAADDRSAREIAACARDFGYRCWEVEHGYFNPRNFNLREIDIFSGRTALAVLALPEEAEAMPDGYAELT